MAAFFVLLCHGVAPVQHWVNPAYMYILCSISWVLHTKDEKFLVFLLVFLFPRTDLYIMIDFVSGMTLVLNPLFF